MSIEDNVRTVQEFFAAIDGRDKQAMLALAADDIEWIRKAVVQIAGEDAAVSYLDHARWEPHQRRILCTTQIAFDRLKDLVGRPLAAKGVSIALQPYEARRLAA